VKGVAPIAGAMIAVLLLPVLAISAIAGAVVSPAAVSPSVCSVDSPADPGAWRAPLRGSFTISSRFGVRFHPVLHRTKLHTGIDLVAAQDRSVVAAAAGTVAVAEFNTAYGNQVVIDHGGGVQSRYAHMAHPASVSAGERVRLGQVLGMQGATGFVTGAHLHFEVIRNGQPLDPAPFMLAHSAPLNGDAPVPAKAVANVLKNNVSQTFSTGDGRRVTLSSEQLTSASLIIRIGRDVGAADGGTTVALMASLQESGLRNLSYGDRDSLGLFQQRAGWGSVAQRQEPDYAIRAFFGGPAGPNQGRPPGLLDIPGWRTMQPGDAAQAVQVSALPDEYAKWEPVATALVEKLSMSTKHGEGCSGPDAAPGQLRVATWNLCLEFCDDKLAPWRARVPMIAAVVKAQRPAVVSLQETGRESSHGKALIEAMAPEYKVAVYKRSKMILFDPKVLSTRSDDRTPLGSLAFVIDGKGGVAQVFREKRTSRSVVVSSLHPVDGAEQRRRSAYVSDAFAQVAQLAGDHPGSAVIHMGDLNSTAPNSPVAEFFEDNGFRSAEQVADVRAGQEFRSYNGGQSPRRGPRIDHVMVREEDVSVSMWRQIFAARRAEPESDHNLIIADLVLALSASPTRASR
jgi:endonuclease/exonuclease/phosphatase family metal-dependent hydrolase